MGLLDREFQSLTQLALALQLLPLPLLALTPLCVEQAFIVFDGTIDIRPDVVDQNVAVANKELAALFQRAPTPQK